MGLKNFAETKTAIHAEDRGKDVEREIQEVAPANKKCKDVKVPDSDSKIDSKIGTKQLDDSLSPSLALNRYLNGGNVLEIIYQDCFHSLFL